MLDKFIAINKLWLTWYLSKLEVYRTPVHVLEDYASNTSLDTYTVCICTHTGTFSWKKLSFSVKNIFRIKFREMSLVVMQSQIEPHTLNSNYA